MSLINQDIKNLVSGISQQPPFLRHPEQLEEQLNGFSSEAAGLQKRPPTLHVANLHRYTKGNKPLIHFINRDEQEQYCVILDGTDISVYDLQGHKYTVNYSGNAKQYIANSSPRTTFKCLTIADYTFVLNMTKTTKMTSKMTTNFWASQGVLVNIKSGQYGRTYRIEINGATVASHATPDGSDKSHTKLIATDYIVDRLAEQASSNGWAIEKGSSWLRLYGKSINTIKVYDGFNNTAAFGIYQTTQKFANLPQTAPANFCVQIIGEKNSDTDDYYVRYDTSKALWVECIRPNIQCQLDMNTMPHVLVRESNGTFTFKVAEWSEREIGDDNSNPLPSFINQTVNDIFYHRNRLGFLSGENIILTRSADFFNFWMASATEVQDTDPIDLAVSDNTIATLYSAVPYDGDLILFSEEAQFSLTAQGVLSPKDAYISAALTHYGASLKAKPVNAGRNIYFPAERSRYTTVREFFTATDNTEAKDVQDITSHVPSYIPNGVYKIIPSTVENILLCLTEGEEDSIYVYKYLFIDGQRQQASWSKWKFSDVIYGGAFINSYLYLVISRNGVLTLERMSFTFNTTDYADEPYRVLLDRKLTYRIPSGFYDDKSDTTSIDIASIYGETYDPLKEYKVVTYDSTLVEVKDNIAIFQGNYSNTIITIGETYLFQIIMSPIMVKQHSDSGLQALTEGRLQLRQLWFNYSNTGYFKVIVNISDKDNYVYENTQRYLGTRSNTLNKIPFTTGTFKIPIQSLNTNCTITLESDEPMPISLVGAGWVGNYVRRTRLY